MNSASDIFSALASGNPLMMPLLLAASFAAGLIAALSPCSLGILPLIIGYIGGYADKNRKRLLIQMLFFSLGLSSVLTIIGILCAVSGRAFAAIAPPAVILVLASIIVLLGFNLLGIIDIQFPAVIKQMPQNKNSGLIIFPFIIGAVSALASSPCAAPILAGIMAFAAASSNIVFSALLLFCFALGQCAVITLFAASAQALKHAGKIARYSEIMLKISGLLLAASGIYMWYAVFSGLRSI